MKMRTIILFVFLYLSLVSFSSLSLMLPKDLWEINSGNPNSNGYIFLENRDVDAGANGQGVTIEAPKLIGIAQPAPNFQAVLNNIYTTTGFFLQNGIGIDYPVSGGRIEWTTTNQGLQAQGYGMVPYYATHKYRFTISTSGGANVWQLCALDLQIIANYECRQEIGSGSVAKNINTSVFVENNVIARGWESTRYDGNFKVDDLVTLRAGNPFTWTKVHRHTGHACMGSWPVLYDSKTKLGAVDGNPIAGGAVKLRKKGLPSRAFPPGSNC